jgi:hypothetical protein
MAGRAIELDWTIEARLGDLPVGVDRNHSLGSRISRPWREYDISRL